MEGAVGVYGEKGVWGVSGEGGGAIGVIWHMLGCTGGSRVRSLWRHGGVPMAPRGGPYGTQGVPLGCDGPVPPQDHGGVGGGRGAQPPHERGLPVLQRGGERQRRDEHLRAGARWGHWEGLGGGGGVAGGEWGGIGRCWGTLGGGGEDWALTGGATGRCCGETGIRGGGLGSAGRVWDPLGGPGVCWGRSRDWGGI